MTQTNASFESRLQHARQQFSGGSFDEAVELIDVVASDHANQARVLVECVRSFAHCYEIQRAEALLEAILPAVPLESRAAVALVFQQIYRPNRAVSVLEDLKAAHGLPLPILAQLAKLYEQSNRQDKAIEALNQCVEQAPAQPQPKVLLARLQRQSGELNAAERLLDLVVSASSASTDTLVHAWSELALVRDKRGDYEQAVVAMECAKSLLRENPQVQQQVKRSQVINNAFQKLYAQINATTIRNWLSEDLAETSSSGVAHLIGFPRSGTTLLEQMLDAHPNIYAGSERTIFTKALFPTMCVDGKLSVDALARCSGERLEDLRTRYVQWHEAIAAQNLSGQILIDKNPNHTSLLIGLIRAFPDSKFVFALRDPRDVIVSTYMRFFSLSEFSASYVTWESTCELYAHEMNVWLKMRSLLPGNWMEVKYEDTVGDPESTTKRVSDLLGLPWNEAMLQSGGDSEKFVYSPTHAEVRKPIYGTSVGRWKHYERYLAPYLHRLEPFIKAFGYD